MRAARLEVTSLVMMSPNLRPARRGKQIRCQIPNHAPRSAGALSHFTPVARDTASVGRPIVSTRKQMISRNEGGWLS